MVFSLSHIDNLRQRWVRGWGGLPKRIKSSTLGINHDIKRSEITRLRNSFHNVSWWWKCLPRLHIRFDLSLISNLKQKKWQIFYISPPILTFLQNSAAAVAAAAQSIFNFKLPFSPAKIKNTKMKEGCKTFWGDKMRGGESRENKAFGLGNLSSLKSLQADCCFRRWAARFEVSAAHLRGSWGSRCRPRAPLRVVCVL